MTGVLRKRRLVVLAACCAAFVALAAGCGALSSSVPKGDVALVDGQPITQTRFDNAPGGYLRASRHQAGRTQEGLRWVQERCAADRSVWSRGQSSSTGEEDGVT